uniref:Small ribosomal subunit protein uS8c n=1 Tax=Discoplastis spathirhyncha TaxID=215771 RepID=A0A3G3LLA9_9EUGL|nr:ribosomal protein S8 [Discoplastis spathirhyncha]AYQ93491.1 ribosomal protein S8 [Discoplastis spathirhyncha]
MNTNDSIGDILTRIRNAIMVKSYKVLIPQTALTISIAQILKNEGFIEGFSLSVDDKKEFLIYLKYKGIKQKSYITCLKRVSKPGLRVYVNKNNIPRVLGGMGIAILSTSYGLLNDKMARFKKIGGEILFFVY